MTRLRRWWPAAAGLALALACDGSLGTETLSISRVEISPPTLNLRTGQSQTVTARVFDDDGGEIIGSDVFWSAEDPNVVTVTQSGLVTGVGAGQTQIAASRGGVSGLATVTVQYTPVARVQVTPPTAIVPIGRTATFGVTLFDEEDVPLSPAGRVITWSSERPEIATINTTTGVATGVALGSTTIRAQVTTPGQQGAVSGTATLTVTNVPVSRVTIAPTTATVHVGAPYARTFTATAFDDADNPLANRQALWTSTNPAVASVETLTGVVTGVSPGTARIRAVVDGVEAFADVTVDLVPVADVTVLPGAVTLAPSQSQALTAVLEDSSGAAITGAALGGRAPTWSSSANGVATVSNTGVVTAVAQGQATITAAVGSASGTSQVTVLAAVGNVSLAITPDSLIGTGQLTGTVTVTSSGGQPLAGRPVTIQSSNSSIATVNAGGTTNGSGQVAVAVNGVAAGSVMITATSSGVSDQQTVRFLSPVDHVVMTAPQTSILLGQGTLQATARLESAGNTPLAGRPVNVTSTDPNVATVSASSANSDGNGEVAITITPVGEGQTDIQATSEGATGSVTITVLAPVSNITFSPGAVVLLLGQNTAPVTATIVDSGGNPLPGRLCTISTQNSTVATVSPISPPDVATDGNGEIALTVSRVGIGTTNINLQCENVTRGFSVTVLP
ncbi:MAG TPA: Ig-like domain-containing protein [Gemmatimonadaceae bacterium]